MATGRSSPDNLKCFRAKGPHGHSRSAKVLAKAGIWIGYAAPNKHNLSFRGLPSFKELKDNCKNMTQPFPPMIDGGASNGTRVAICRACGSETSPAIDLLEIQVMKRPLTKVTIMPLHDNGQSGELFCILLPQRNDRSLQGLEVFRPYELGNDGSTFTSNFELLSARNRSWVRTEGEAVEALGIPSEETAGPTLTPSRSVSHQSPERTMAARPMTKTKLRSGRERSATGGFVDRATRTQPSSQGGLQDSFNDSSLQKRKVSDSVHDDTSRHKRQATGTPARTQAPTPISREVSHATPETPSNDDTTVLLVLAEEHAKRVLLVWIVVVDDIEYDFSHTLYECPTFSSFLDLVLTEAADDPQVTEKVDGSIMWRLAYQIPGQLKKAFTLRIDANDQGYERLLHSLAQSSFWDDVPHGKINVELRILA
ncbi:hypothetical protein P171DRAFT_431781 [Karstenula rhodostoma CBS 690.94]|uniref:Uncharacterized protein n=1 Tax=Karstenula rhodostoma CBS 690.94 TaxID=1392251 RepID=A0A9P4UCA6_9PLEO|nr:hypothetical protein P171DRAFT_431781 [Karstenula rhodostoma CBS 690.94]